MLPCGIKPQQLPVAKGQPGCLGQQEEFNIGSKILPRWPFKPRSPEPKTNQPPKAPPTAPVRQKSTTPIKAPAEEEAVIKSYNPSEPGKPGKIYVVQFSKISEFGDGVMRQGLMLNLPVDLAEPGEHAILVETNPSKTVFYKAQMPGMTFSVPKGSRYQPEPMIPWVVEQRLIRPNYAKKVQAVLKDAMTEMDMSSLTWANLVVRKCEKAGYLYPKA